MALNQSEIRFNQDLEPICWVFDLFRSLNTEDLNLEDFKAIQKDFANIPLPQLKDVNKNFTNYLLLIIKDIYNQLLYLVVGISSIFVVYLFDLISLFILQLLRNLDCQSLFLLFPLN